MDKNITITIFTPTYNRAYILPRLYDSLCRQSDKDFIWLIVDDGSNDNTRFLIENWICEKKINIAYHYQKNSGKMQAHNYGVKLTETLLFSCVDSDDYLVKDAVERIKTCYRDHTIDVGILCMRGTSVTSPITKWKSTFSYATLYEAEKYYGLVGDTMLIFKTDILKRHYFPKFEGEKFIPESFLYDQLSCEGKLYFYPEILYLCEYLPDGYTKNIRRINANNPEGYTAFINQRLSMDKKLKDRIQDTIRYVAIRFVIKDRRMIQNAQYPILALLCIIPGFIFYRKAYCIKND